MVRAGILGGSGYTGLELMRLIDLHPEVELVWVTSRKYAGQQVTSLFPSLIAYKDLKFVDPSEKEANQKVDVVFTAVPHQTAMNAVPKYLAAGSKVVDLSADFRIKDQAVYEKWYVEHTAPELLKEAVYGLPELYEDKIAQSRLVANPGCYPTSTILPLLPLLKHGLIQNDGIVVDSKSGASGAGRSASVALLFCEVNEGFKAYKVGEHRHTPEIEQELSNGANQQVVINFTPHLVPMSRGILTTTYSKAKHGVQTADVLQCLRQEYSNALFVNILPEGSFPNVAHVRGTNFCFIGAYVDNRAGRVITVSAIDNLTKGASGQAIQNMNIMFGMDQKCGLNGLAISP